MPKEVLQDLSDHDEDMPLRISERGERRLSIFILCMVAYLLISTALLPPTTTANTRQVLDQNGMPITYVDTLGKAYMDGTRLQYVVNEGDTLTGIATRYGYTLTELLAVNAQIQNPDSITLGQVIILP